MKCAPDTGPNIKMMAKSPAAVAAAFSNSSSPTLPGESCCAAMPEPMTMAARKALPSSSASKRRHSAASFIHDPGRARSGRPMPQQQALEADRTDVAPTGIAGSPAGAQPSVEHPRSVSSGASASTV